MPECQNCGNFVTQDFVRVFGVDGKVEGCTECKSQGDARRFAGLNELEHISR